MGMVAIEKSGFKKGDKVMALLGGGGYAGIVTRHAIRYIHIVCAYLMYISLHRILHCTLPSGYEGARWGRHD